jgi:hypothetical protein
MISQKLGMVIKAANGGTMIQEKTPPINQNVSQDHPFTFLYGK